MKILGDPVGSAVNAFSTMARTMSDLQDAPIKRQLMEEEVADRKQRRAKGELDMTRERDKMDQEKQERDTLERDKDFASALTKQKANAPDTSFTPGEKSAIDHYYKNHAFADGEEQSPHEVKAAQETLINFFQKSPALQEALTKGGKIGVDQLPPEAKDSLMKVYGPAINGKTSQGPRQSIWGPIGKDNPNGCKQEIDSIIINPQGPHGGPAVSFKAKLTCPVQENQKFKHQQADGNSDIYMAPSEPKPEGLVSPGNIDLTKQPVIGHADGGISTVYSASFEQDGKQVLVPLVRTDGKIIDTKQAIKEYNDPESPYYQKHLGVFETPAAADRYAEKLHADPMWDQDKKDFSVPKGTKERSRTVPITMGGSTDPNAPIAQIPFQLLAANLLAQHDITTAKIKSDMQTEMEARTARHDPYGTMKGMQKKEEDEKDSQRYAEALQGKTGRERYQKYISTGGRNKEIMKELSTESAQESKEKIEEKKADAADKRLERRELAMDDRAAKREVAADRRLEKRLDHSGGGGGKEKKIPESEIKDKMKLVDGQIKAKMNVEKDVDYKVEDDEDIASARSEADKLIREGKTPQQAFDAIKDQLPKKEKKITKSKEEKEWDQGYHLPWTKKPDFSKKEKTLSDPDEPASKSNGKKPEDKKDSPPASALKEGKITKFANGQKWTLKNGKPVRVD